MYTEQKNKEKRKKERKKKQTNKLAGRQTQTDRHT
jgi:hypothetical protein